MTSERITKTKTVTNGQAHYKMTRTVTGPDGKTHTETIEVKDDDAVKLMRNLRSNQQNVPDFDSFGFRPLAGPSNFRSFDRDPPKSTASQSALRGSPWAASSSSFSRDPSSASASETSKNSKAEQTEDEFLKDSLRVHNELRRRHGVEPLRLNKDLCKLAQQWANHLASTGALVHSKTKYKNVNVGENLRCQSWHMTGREMTESWYNECQKYDYNNPSYQPGTGHFTQVVWKGSEEVGFARAPGSSMNFGVAMYYPPGNYVGEFNRHVFRPN